ncbi:IPT/TIG domain-containing protein, partial [Candidatus Uhrbacteria bacterium]|nr:IPT/TIG domain-containing protein [Candidatus Uhrbacteria bacterium]
MNHKLGIKELKSRPPAQRQWMRRVFAFTVSIILASLFMIPASSAGALETGIDFGTATGLSTQDIRVTVAKIIRAAFGLLGIVGLGIVLAGGFLWMTSSGNEEKLAKAKQLLTNGAIGLTIMLLSFAITQFAISRLTSALYGSGAVTIATEGGGGLPPGALPGGCVDPGGAVPFVCTISPTSGPVGAYVTIRGYRFAPYTDGSSSVRIGGVLAPVVACGGGANWADNLIVVEVPTLDAGRSHPVQVTAGGGGVSGNPVVFGVTADPVGPQIACIVPNQGPEGTILSIDGKNFGAERGTADVRFGGGVSVTSITSWMDTAIGTSIPAGAQSGDVTVVRDTQTSNGYPLTVTCSAGTQCSVSNCCTQGQCVEAAACAPGGPPATVGASCDGNTATPACEPVACGGGLRCEASACTCQEGPVITSVSPQTLVSTTDGTAYRRPEDVPAGTQTVIAPNGAPGNYLSIRGSGFGATPGRVIFLGAEGATDDVGATLAACTTAWSDQQVVVAIPAGAALGPIRIETIDPQFFDATDDARGTAIEQFRPNTTQRPGVCAVTPAAGQIGATVTMAGVQFGAARGAEDAVLFGDLSSGATSVWSATAITTVVPNLAEGSVPVRIRASGEFSNEVAFTREAAPRVPRIQEIIPATGGPGQYVTIRGEYFGSEIGKLMFKRGTEEYEVVPRFPDLCARDWWRDTEITARIPANNGEWGPPVPPSDFNALGTYEVRVQAREGATLRSSNAMSFDVTADPPSPGICAITPSSGPARTLIRVIGERFGGAEGIMRFFDGVTVGSADKGNFQWGDGEVSGVLVPAAATTGPVRLWASGAFPDAPAAENRGSNPVTFEVRDCRAGGTSACAAGNICCGNGTCVANAAACAAGPNRGSFQWTFATGVIPKVPRVVESCVPADATTIPSPSPWDQQGQGQEACVNANIAIRFTASMDIADAAVAQNGMQVFRCGGGSNAAAALGGDFEGAGLAGGWTVVDSERLSASAETVVTPVTAHGGTGVLNLEKRVATAADQPRTTDLPRDTPVDRHYFAITAPSTLITDTNGTTYTARVFVRGENPNANPNMRAGIVVGRFAGDTPTDVGWWQQVANEVTLNGTWQELSAAVTFDAGPNHEAPGFVRLYLTGPPIGAPAAADDTYTAQFDDLEVVRQGDVCATREEMDGLTFQVASEGGRLQLENNIVTVAPVAGSWATGTWYEVILAGNDGTMTNSGVSPTTRAFRSAGTPQLRLDGDKDGVEGGNYRFRFRTRTSSAACAIQSAVTTPSDAVATQRGPAAAAALTGPNALHPGLVHLRADGRADPAACFTLAASSMDWSWTTVQPAAGSAFASVDSDGQGRWCRTSDECAVVSCATAAACAPFGAGTACVGGRCAVNFCSANRCTFVPAAPAGATNFFSNTKTASGFRETPLAADGSPQPVLVRATVAAATPRTGTSNVVVRFEKPRVTAVYP